MTDPAKPDNATPTEANTDSRRTFLKRSGLSVAGTGLAASITTLAQLVHAQGSASLKLGLVGCGGRGSGAALQALRADPNTELVAVADAFGDKAERSLKNLKADEKVGERVNTTPDTTFIGLDAYKKVIDMSDVVLLCTPPGFRPQHFRAAVEAGKHIFTEKPMATDFPGVRSVIESVKMSKEKNLAVLAGLSLIHI